MAKPPPPNISDYWDAQRDWSARFRQDAARQLTELVSSKSFQTDLRCAESGNKAAARRLRKSLQELVKLAQNARKDGLDIINMGKTPAKKPPKPTAEQEPQDLEEALGLETRRRDLVIKPEKMKHGEADHE